MFRNGSDSSDERHLPRKVNRGTLTEIPQVCVDAFCERRPATANIDDDGSITSRSASSSITIDGIHHKKTNLNCSVAWNMNRAYFLTHFDDEILEDVLNTDFLNMLMDWHDETVRLYMHELSYEFLLFWARKEEDNFDEVFCLLLQLRQKSKIVFLEVDTPIKLLFPSVPGSELHTHQHSAPGLVIQVTTLSAGHNIGSVMLLFERIFHHPHTRTVNQAGDYFNSDEDEEELRILYTGSCRLQLSDLSSFPALFHNCGDLKVITSLYIDTAFCLPYVEELPSRKTVEDELLEMVVSCMGQADVAQAQEQDRCRPCQFEIWTQDTTTCALHFIQSIASAFRQPVRISRRLSILFEQIPNLKACWELNECQKPTRFHYLCSASENEKHRSRNVGPILNISLQCKMHRELRNEPTEDEVELFEKSYSIYTNQPGKYIGIHCTHLSKFELARMVNFLRVDPLAVKPLHCPVGIDLEDVLTELKNACDDVVECQPGDFEDENPSQAYDFTDIAPSKIPPAALTKLKLKGARPRPPVPNPKRTTEFYHYYEDDLYNSLYLEEDLLKVTTGSRDERAAPHGKGDAVFLHFDNLPASPATVKAKARNSKFKKVKRVPEAKADVTKASFSSSVMSSTATQHDHGRDQRRKFPASR